MALLTEAEIRKNLEGLKGWSLTGKTIERQLEFPDFKAAMKFVNAVAEAAEAANHHPDITINYNKVRFVLTSHDSGGVTQRDIKMAGKINQILGK
ncbi:MAG TPA: 4a-hydroxytetrahydrobiopterin dehydratase [Terriglobales bacterium]|jgi:4a-hydroxytetrahydrobiopterin dehydratase|nr:4a-hydroxytetrahydrobiopterin dehydratase [Terriglobales bacterium]